MSDYQARLEKYAEIAFLALMEKNCFLNIGPLTAAEIAKAARITSEAMAKEMDRGCCQFFYSSPDGPRCMNCHQVRKVGL